MPQQRQKLIDTLTLAVRSLNNLDVLHPALKDLGRRHRGYGVTAAHYDSVGQALLWTLERGLGPQWTPATAAAWTELHGSISAVMLRGAEMRGERAA